MPDFDAITTAVAARFAPAQVTPPAGYQNVRSATADLPNLMPPLPCVLVFLDSGTFETGNGTRIGGREGQHTFTVRFYYSQNADLSRDMVALRKWLTVLVDQFRLAVQLGGLTGVTRVTVDSWTVGSFQYANDMYTGIEFGVGLVTSEPWAAVA